MQIPDTFHRSALIISEHLVHLDMASRKLRWFPAMLVLYRSRVPGRVYACIFRMLATAMQGLNGTKRALGTKRSFPTSSFTIDTKRGNNVCLDSEHGTYESSKSVRVSA
jgi:hypothetical protein